LVWGQSVYAKLVAYNLYGDSETSDAGLGAVIFTFADAPLDLVEDSSKRTASSITVQWSEGANNGGSIVTDYRVSYDKALGVFEVLAAGVISNTYTTTGLTYGLTYKFRVEAKNAFGYSEPSLTVAILCASHPEAPNAPSTSVVND
jgi:titin